MRRRPVAFILLAALLASGLGLPQYVHALVHHARPAPDDAAPVACALHGCAHHAKAAAKEAPAGHADDEAPHPDDCDVCQFLAGAAALPPALVSVCSLAAPVSAIAHVMTGRLIGCLVPARAAPRAPPLL